MVLKKGGVPTLADNGHLLVGDTIGDEEPVRYTRGDPPGVQERLCALFVSSSTSFVKLSTFLRCSANLSLNVNFSGAKRAAGFLLLLTESELNERERQRQRDRETERHRERERERETETERGRDRDREKEREEV